MIIKYFLLIFAMGNQIKPVKKCLEDPSKQLYNNIKKLSESSSICQKIKQEQGYDKKREELISKIEQNLNDGADVHYYGNGMYNNFQLAYVLDQDEVTELMIPYVRNQPPYYNIPCIPFLTHSYMNKGKGYLFRSNDKEYKFSVSENIYKSYLDIATDAEKQDLEDYKSRSGKYSRYTCRIDRYFSDLCKKEQPNNECEESIQRYLNTMEFVPPEFKK